MFLATYFYQCPLNESTEFLGTCKGMPKSEVEEFENRIRAWCIAYDRDYRNVVKRTHALGRIFASAGAII